MNLIPPCLFAIESPTAQEGWSVVMTIGILLSIVVSAATLITMRLAQKREVSSGERPFRVEGAPRYQTMEGSDVASDVVGHRMDAIEGTILRGDDRRRETYAKIEAVRAEMKTDVAAVHERLNAVAVEVGGLSRMNVLFSQQLAQVDAKLDRLIERRA